MDKLCLCVVLLLAVAGVDAHWPHTMDAVNVNNVEQDLDFAISIGVSPSRVPKNNAFVTVSWRGVAFPTENDWIGVYSPSGADVQSVVPVKYQYASLSPSHMFNGSGSLNFQLINMRAAYDFVFFRNGTHYPIASAVSNTVEFENVNEPLQAHIALGDVPNTMRLTWVTRDAEHPTVYWGTQSGGPYTNKAAAQTSTYTRAELCGPPANTTGYREPGLIHSAIMYSLAPGEIYYYIYGDEVLGMAEERSFVAPLAPGSATRAAVYGDMGYEPLDDSYTFHTRELAALNVTRLLKKKLPDLDVIMHFGDVSYARGYAADWDAYMSEIEDMATSVPYMTGEGNHERDWWGSGSLYDYRTDSGGECGIPYYARFPMPGVTGGAFNAWYSYNFGNIHFIVMSTEQPFVRGTAQYAFIAHDLAAVDRSATPWIILTGHRPMYISSTNTYKYGGDQPVASLLREHIEPLMIQYQVSLGLWGHHHSYQRSCPVSNTSCVTGPNQDDYPVQVVVGTAGFESTTNIQPVNPKWAIMVNDHTHGAGFVTTDGRGTLVFEYIDSNTGETLDKFSRSLPSIAKNAASTS